MTISVPGGGAAAGGEDGGAANGGSVQLGLYTAPGDKPHSRCRGSSADPLASTWEPNRCAARSRENDYDCVKTADSDSKQDSVRTLVDEEGLRSYGPNLADLMRRSASYVDRVLKGAKLRSYRSNSPRRSGW